MRNIVTFNSLGHYGRLANQMYQIAGTIGIARRNGMDFAFPHWKNYDHAERFGSQEDIDVQKYFVNPLPIYNGPILPDTPVHWGYHDIRLNKSTSISGHLQSQKYFDHCLDEVRWYFRMKDELKPTPAIAIHCRLGDYDNQYHPRLGREYYIEALKHLPKMRTILFSDEPYAAYEMLKEVVQFTDVVTGKDYLNDFRLMKSCRHFIIGNSSYSAMAAVLGEAPDKIVVAPHGDNWFGKKYTNITGKDIINSDWRTVRWQQIVSA